MRDDEAIADALDAFAVQVIRACEEQANVPTARLVLGRREAGAWFVLFYFGSNDALLRAVKGGDAYVVHQTFTMNAERIIGDVRVQVLFEGAFPEQSSGWVDAVLARCEEQYGRGVEASGAPLPRQCELCGHDGDAHRLCGWRRSETEPPMDGWMVCADERCPCFRTWSVRLDSASESH